MAINYPLDLINAINWKLTLPVGNPTEIKYPALATYADEWFHLNEAGSTGSPTGVVFKARTDGAHTSGSNNPRSELREMSADGKTNAAWSTSTGVHSMEIEQAVNALPIGTKPVVVVGQIHGSSDDLTVYRVEKNTYSDNTGDPALCSIWITKGDSTRGHLVTNSYKLGDKFTVGFEVSAGQIAYTFNGVVLGYSYTKKASGCYFKAGSYNQSGGIVTKLPSGESDYAEVTIYALQVCHSSTGSLTDGVCTGNAPGTVTNPPATKPDTQALVDALTGALLTYQNAQDAAMSNLAGAFQAAIDKFKAQ